MKNSYIVVLLTTSIVSFLLVVTMISSKTLMVEYEKLKHHNNSLQEQFDTISSMYEQQVDKVERTNSLRATEFNTYNSKYAEFDEKVVSLEKEIETFGIEWFCVPGIITAYTPYDDLNGINSEGDPSVTSTGKTAGEGIFAVDPKRIPYGSEIRIVYEDGTVEEGIAGDTGGALRNNIFYQVDVFRQTFDEGEEFGIRAAVIYWKPNKKAE